MEKGQFFYCYDIKLMQHLKNQGIKYITKAIHPNTMRLFFLYQKTDEFQEKLDKFQTIKTSL